MKLSQFFAPKQNKEVLQSTVTSDPKKRPLNDKASTDQGQKKPRTAQQSKLSSFFAVKPKATASQENREIIKDKKTAELSAPMVDMGKNNKEKNVNAWRAIFKGPPEAPPCKGHKEPSVLRTVKKKGPNFGKQFWCCSRGEGRADDPNARCDFFKWVK